MAVRKSIRTYTIVPDDCLGRARLIVRSLIEFERLSQGCRVIKAEYEELAEAIAGARMDKLPKMPPHSRT